MPAKKPKGPEAGTITAARQRSSMSIGTLEGIKDDCQRMIEGLDALILTTQPRTHTNDIPHRTGWVAEIGKGVIPDEKINDLVTFKIWVERLRSGAEAQREKVRGALAAFWEVAKAEEAAAKAQAGI